MHQILYIINNHKNLALNTYNSIYGETIRKLDGNTLNQELNRTQTGIKTETLKNLNLIYGERLRKLHQNIFKKTRS